MERYEKTSYETYKLPKIKIMKILSKIYLAVFIVLGILPLNAKIKMSPYYADNMMFQRDAPIKFKGTATPKTKVGVILKEQKQQVEVDKDGKWEITLEAMPASKEPVDIQIYEGSKCVKTIKNVLFGDIWVLGGQSNMEMTVGYYPEYAEIAKKADYPTIRYFKSPRGTMAEKPLEDFVQGSVWYRCTPANVRGYSAVGFFFAQKVAKEADVPIGLIYTALGASCMWCWTPDEEFSKIPEYSAIRTKYLEEKKKYTKEAYEMALAEYKAKRAVHDKKVAEAKKNKKPIPVFHIPYPTKLSPWAPYRTPSYLYNANIAPMKDMQIKGVLWYQGESAPDAENPNTFEDKFKLLVSSWRKNFNNPELPFYCVQLASIEQRKNWPEIRAIQLKVASSDTNMGIASAIDLGEAKEIHPKFKDQLGQRLALIALKKVYGKTNLVATHPTLKNVRYGRYNAKVFFNFEGKELKCKGVERGFEIYVNGNWIKPKASFVNNTVILKHEFGEAIEGVRYLWKQWAQPDVCIYAENNLPALPFQHFKK